MKIIGITGKSGAGKTTVTKYFKKYDAEIIDADILAREVVKKGMPALAEIEKEWKDVVENGSLNRRALAKIVFNDASELHKLNTITHKYIVEEIKERIKNSHAEIFVIDAIALFESGLSKLCDVTICVTADKDVRIKRIMARDNLTKIEAEERINAQQSDEFYEEKVDFIIFYNETESNLEEVVDGIVKGSKS